MELFLRDDRDNLLRQLTALCRAKTGDPAAAVQDLAELPGHAGFSYGFTLVRPSASPERLVLRLAPPGVPARGPADVVRQARVMSSLARTPVPAPPVKWFGDDPQWFGRPFSVVGFVEGKNLARGDVFSPEEAKTIATQALQVMAELHRLSWRERVEAWGEPVTLQAELARLDRLLDRDDLDPSLIRLAPKLRSQLLGEMPQDPRLGCVHGDFQWTNLLFDADGIKAVVDWELSQIGATLIDLGWLCLFSDRDSWERDALIPFLVPAEVPHPNELIDLYRTFCGADVLATEIGWFRAFACYRFGVITAFNLMLHRRGKRPDPLWEDIGRSGNRLFERGLELLAERR